MPGSSRAPGPLTSSEVGCRLLDGVEVARRTSRYGDTVYVLRHPRGISHVELDATDYQVVGWMDGRASLVDLASRYFEVHHQLAIHRIRRLVATLSAAGLALTDAQTLPEDSAPPAVAGLQPTVESISSRFRWAAHGGGLLAVAALAGAGLLVLIAQLVSGRGPSMLIGGSLTLGTLFALGLMLVIAVVHEFGHAIAVIAANRRLGRVAIDVRRIGLAMDTSDILMAPRRGRVGVAIAGSLAGGALGGVLVVVGVYVPPALASPILLAGYLSYTLNLMNLLPAGQLDGRRALGWFLETPDPLRQAWKEVLSGAGGALSRRLAAEAATACVATALVAGSVALLLGWAAVAGALWLVDNVASLRPVDLVLPSILGALLLATLLSRPVLSMLVARGRRRALCQACSERAREVLTTMPLLVDLDASEREHLLGSARFEQVERGRSVVRQGAPGNRFYVILEGTASVRQWRPAGGDQLVARLGSGDFFGELALLRRARRAASVIATSDLVLMSIDRPTFDRMIAPRLHAREATERLLRGRSVLARTPLFRQLAPLEIDWVLSRLEPVQADAGQYIIRQGESGDHFYLIVAGVCRVWHEQPTSGRARLAQLGPGDHFGEIALLHDIPRTATVTAETVVDLLTLSRADFLELFGEPSELARPLGDFRQACYSTAAARLAELDRATDEATRPLGGIAEGQGRR